MSVSMGLRFRVLARGLFTCRYCGAHPPDVTLEVDHIIPVSAGGRDTLTNLVAACWACNRGKHALVMAPEVVAYIAPPAELPLTRPKVVPLRRTPKPRAEPKQYWGIGSDGPYVGADVPAQSWICERCGFHCTLEGDVCSCNKPRYFCTDCAIDLDDEHGYEDGRCEDCHDEYWREVYCAECGVDWPVEGTDLCRGCATAEVAG